MKRFLVDGAGNYAFFVPTVGVTNWLVNGWNWDIFVGYAIVSVPFALFSGRAFTLFLTKVWYPLCRERL